MDNYNQVLEEVADLVVRMTTPKIQEAQAKGVPFTHVKLTNVFMTPDLMKVVQNKLPEDYEIAVWEWDASSIKVTWGTSYLLFKGTDL